MRVLVSKERSVKERVAQLSLAEHPDVEIVGDFSGTVGLLLAVAQQQAEIVVISATEPQHRAAVSHLFAEYPDLTVLALDDRSQVFIEQRCPSRRQIDDLGLDNLVETLHCALSDPCDGADVGTMPLN